MKILDTVSFKPEQSVRDRLAVVLTAGALAVGLAACTTHNDHPSEVITVDDGTSVYKDSLLKGGACGTTSAFKGVPDDEFRTRSMGMDVSTAGFDRSLMHLSGGNTCGDQTELFVVYGPLNAFDKK